MTNKKPTIHHEWKQTLNGWNQPNVLSTDYVFKLVKTYVTSEILAGLDNEVKGDDHPEALKMIMDAYYKIEDDRIDRR